MKTTNAPAIRKAVRLDILTAFADTPSIALPSSQTWSSERALGINEDSVPRHLPVAGEWDGIAEVFGLAVKYKIKKGLPGGRYLACIRLPGSFSLEQAKIHEEHGSLLRAITEYK